VLLSNVRRYTLTLPVADGRGQSIVAFSSWTARRRVGAESAWKLRLPEAQPHLQCKETRAEQLWKSLELQAPLSGSVTARATASSPVMMAGVGIRLICFIPATREDMLCGNERANALLRPLFSEAPLSYSSEVQSQ